MGVSYKAAARLVRTELNHLFNQAAIDGYKRDGIEEYRFIATLDARTCEECGALDRKKYKVSEAKTGVNLPPIHPNDRCVTVPVVWEGLEDEGMTRIARHDDRTTYDVPADMTYEEWAKKHGASSAVSAGSEAVERPLTPEVPSNMTYAEWQKSQIGGIINSGGEGKIDIEIDELTSCLRDRDSGRLLDTSTSPMTLSEARRLKSAGWNFDWTKPYRYGMDVFKLTIPEVDKRQIQGAIALREDVENRAVFVDIVEAAPGNIGKDGKYKGVGGHLFAYACLVSKRLGHDFVYFDAKTALIKYYEEMLGAERILGTYRMTLEGLAIERLIRKYYGKELGL